MEDDILKEIFKFLTKLLLNSMNYTVRKIQNFWAADVPISFSVILLEFISNLPEKFRNNTSKFLELPSIKPESLLKNSESKKRSERPQVRFVPAVSRLEGKRVNHYTVVDLL